MMKQLFIDISTNGRYGLAVVGEIQHDENDNIFPIRGDLKYIGLVSGIETFQVIPNEFVNTWILPISGHGVKKIHGGASLVIEKDLQSHNIASLLVLGEKAIFEMYGYKQRSSRIKVYLDGKFKEMPPSVLAAMGFVHVEKSCINISPPSQLPTIMQQAFEKMKV